MLRPPGEKEFKLGGDRGTSIRKLISALQGTQLLQKGCSGFLVCVMEEKSEAKIEEILIVREFANLFPEDLLGILPFREIEVTIDLLPSTSPTFKAPYRMAPLELKELKYQLQELLDKGFIRPSVSLRGAPILFVEE